MASLSELARLHTTLDRDDIAHLQRLVSEWGMLADFCFADMLLYTPSRDGRWLVVGQVRPVTSQTLYLSDWVGAWANESERPVLSKAWDGAITEGEVTVEGSGLVGFGDGEMIAAAPLKVCCVPQALPVFIPKG